MLVNQFEVERASEWIDHVDSARQNQMHSFVQVYEDLHFNWNLRFKKYNKLLKKHAVMYLFFSAQRPLCKRKLSM